MDVWALGRRSSFRIPFWATCFNFSFSSLYKIPEVKLTKCEGCSLDGVSQRNKLISPEFGDRDLEIFKLHSSDGRVGGGGEEAYVQTQTHKHRRGR